jgi:L-alanine-DL-glutamate epimerase-like enolase superfamily enzyme
VNERHYTLVRVTDTDGVTGIGFCYAGNFGGEVTTLAVRRLLAPSLIGPDSHRVRGLWDEAWQSILLSGRAGMAVRALSAIDNAIWDLNARRAGLPLWKYLGATADAKVPAYASGGYYLDGKGPQQLAEEMSSYVEMGFGAVKLKVGAVSPREDGARLAAVREAVGPDVLVMLDANNAWRDVPTALEAMKHLEPYDPYWIEEPFGPDDIGSHAELARRTSVVVATGEIEVGVARHQQLLEAGGALILQTDAAVCGGITEYQRIAAVGGGFGATMAPHWFHDLHIHLVASTSNARFVEFFPDDKVLNFRKLIDRQLTVLPGGFLELPAEPGLGFGFDDAAVDAFAVDAWA